MRDDASKRWPSGKGGLIKIDLVHPSGACAEIYRHGGHLTAWKSAAGNNWIFTSECAKFDGSSPIRGGVPIIFPQFNEFGSGPRHGFARNVEWQTVEQSDSRITLLLESGDATKVWPYQFRTEFNVVVDAFSLKMTLSITNMSDTPFEFTCALHTYFRIHSLSTSRVDGLTGLEYWNNDGSDFTQRRIFEAQHLRIDDAFDRVFFNYQRPIILHSKQKQLQIEHSGFKDIVIWNPGETAAQKMSDFADDEYEHMLCIEAAQIDHPVQLQPGATWEGQQHCSDLGCS
jgi:glucose-6-phosphate 1-epimerase